MKTRRLGKIAIILVAFSLIIAVPKPSPAKFQDQDTIAYSLGGFVALCAASYFVWQNRPANQDKVDWSLRGPGGFYVGGFMGGSMVQSTNWKFPFTTTSKVNYSPGVVGGLKFGYFFHGFPYFGLEYEGNYTRNDLSRGSVTLSPPVGGQSSGAIKQANLDVLTSSIHLLGRYGFLPDQEVPFGRLQPYAGLGPGWVIMWTTIDSAKNFSVEALGGIRYMLLKNLSVFVEYKYSMVWAAELEDTLLRLNNGSERGKPQLDFSSHKIVLGLSFHFF